MSTPGVFKRIPDRDKSVTPFKVFKSWRFDTPASMNQLGVDRLVAIKPDKRLFEGNPVAFGHWTTIKDTGSFYVNSTNDKEPSLIWYSIDHLYYKRAGVPFDTFGYADPFKIERTLVDEASVISIPQNLYGEQIKPGSVNLYLKNSQLNATTMSLVDDGKGNLIDIELSSSISNEIFYLGFNNYTYESLYTDSVPESVIQDDGPKPIKVDTIIPDISLFGKNVRIVPRYNLPSSSIQWGNAAYFTGNGYIRIPNNDPLNFKMDEDFAISFWIHRDSTNASDSYILSKRTAGVGQYLNRQTGKIITGDVNYKTSQYPYEILYKASTGNLVCRQSNGAKITELETSKVVVGSRSHIIFQKTGSVLELYVNGELESNSTINLSEGNLQNEADIFIGSLGIDSSKNGVNGMKGALDEFFVFNKGLTASEAYQLAYTGSMNLMTTNTNVVGNVFYEQGIIVVSDPRPKYGTTQYRMFNDVLLNPDTGNLLPSYIDVCKLEFSSTVTIYEHEYIIKLREDEFNFTSNPTIRRNNDQNSDLPKAFVSNPYFAPYVTTIGLYNKNYELIAIAKLASPIHKRDDVDLNIIVKFDVTT